MVNKPRSTRHVDTLPKTFQSLALSLSVLGALTLLSPNLALADTTPNLYKVQRGDTLLGVANKFQISAKALATENKKQVTDNLLTNEILILPSTLFADAPPATAVTTMPATTTPKTVPKAVTKTITKTASPQKTAITSTTKNPFYETQQVTTDNASSSTPATTKAVKAQTYTVQSGDSLTSLAKKNKITVSEIQKLNPTLTSTTLKVGQKIKIPTANLPPVVVNTPAINISNFNKKASNTTQVTNPKITLESYTVKMGDTLTSVANRYHLTVNDISKINQIMPDTVIKVGQNLMIPVANAKKSVKAKP